MSFKIKDKIINVTLMSLVTMIFSITFAVLVLRDGGAKYDETMKNIILVIVGSFFNNGISFNSNKNSE